MNEELATYITRLCELSGHTTRIDDDLILVEPGHSFIYDAFTMVEEYYAYGHVERYSFSGEDFGSASFEIFKKFAIMHFAADIRAAHQLPPLNVPAVTDVLVLCSVSQHREQGSLSRAGTARRIRHRRVRGRG